MIQGLDASLVKSLDNFTQLIPFVGIRPSRQPCALLQTSKSGRKQRLRCSIVFVQQALYRHYAGKVKFSSLRTATL
jgi:hypothetical protein